MNNLFNHIKGLKSNLVSHLEKSYDIDGRFLLNLPLQKYFFTSNKNDYTEILIKRYFDFEKGKSSRILKLLFGGGIVVAPLSRWKKNRKIIGPAFTKNNAHNLSGYIERILEKWSKEVLVEGKHNIFEAFNKLSVVIAMKSTLGVANEQFENPFYYNIQDAQKIVISKVKGLINIDWIPSTENRQFKKIIKEIRSELDSYLQNYLKSQNSLDESDYKYPIDALAKGFRSGQLKYAD